MEKHKSQHGIYGEGKKREAEYPYLVKAAGSLGEPQPAEGEREGDEAGEQHAPENTLVRQPAIPAAPANKLLREQVDDSLWYQQRILPEVLIGEKKLPASPPVTPRGRARQPERVFVGDSSNRKD